MQTATQSPVKFTFSIPNRVLTTIFSIGTVICFALVGLTVAVGRTAEKGCPCTLADAKVGKRCCIPVDRYLTLLCNANQCLCFIPEASDDASLPLDYTDINIRSADCQEQDKELSDGAVAAIVMLMLTGVGLLIGGVVSCTCYEAAKTKLLRIPVALNRFTSKAPAQETQSSQERTVQREMTVRG